MAQYEYPPLRAASRPPAGLRPWRPNGAICAARIVGRGPDLPATGISANAATYDLTVDIAPLTPRVLVIGLDPYRVPGPGDPKPVADAIEAGMARFAERGVGAESCLFGLDGSDDVETVIAAALCARPWECVVIGGGVRKPDDQLELFERVVNLVRRHAPDAAIAFNATAAGTFDADPRWVDIPS